MSEIWLSNSEIENCINETQINIDDLKNSHQIMLEELDDGEDKPDRVNYGPLFMSEKGEKYYELLLESRIFAEEKFLITNITEMKYLINRIPFYIDKSALKEIVELLINEILIHYEKQQNKSDQLKEEEINENLGKVETFFNNLQEYILTWYDNTKAKEDEIQSNQDIVKNTLRRFLAFHIFTIFSYTEAFYNDLLKILIKFSLDHDDPINMKFETRLLTRGNPFKKIEEVMRSFNFNYQNSALNFYMKELENLTKLRNKAAHGDPLHQFLQTYSEMISDKSFIQESWKDKYEDIIQELGDEISSAIYQLINIPDDLREKHIIRKLLDQTVKLFKRKEIMKRINEPVKSYIESELTDIIEYITGIEHFTENVLILGAYLERLVVRQSQKVEKLEKSF